MTIVPQMIKIPPGNLKGKEVKGFCLGKFPITNEQWKVVSAYDPVEIDLISRPGQLVKPDIPEDEILNLPVDSVSWYEALEFCKRISRETSKFFRLPTRTEWEFACRAGTTTRYPFGDSIYRLDCNFDVEGIKKTGTTTPVGSYEICNGFGLYDMNGNVWEWCLNEKKEMQEKQTDSPFFIPTKLACGGSWFSHAENCCSDSVKYFPSNGHDDTVGFRVAYSC